MSAAAPTNTTTPLPIDLEQRQAALMKLTVSALKATFLKAGVTPPSGGKPVLVSEGAKNDLVMAAQGWAIEPTAAEVDASTGDVDTNGDIVGATPEHAPMCDDDGFPVESADVTKLDDDHLDQLGGWLYAHPDFPNPPSYSQTSTAVIWQVTRERKIAFIVEHGGYEEPTAVATDATNDAAVTTEQLVDAGHQVVAEAAVHIPTAAPEPTTVTTDELAKINADKEGADAPEACACNGRGGFETDGGWEKCTNCDGAVEEGGQLTLVPGGEAPAKSILNIAALRHDLGTKTEFKDGDRVRVTFEIEVDKISFLPEKSGGDSKRRMRTHAGAIDLETVEIVAV